jgi:hypothetical protein
VSQPEPVNSANRWQAGLSHGVMRNQAPSSVRMIEFFPERTVVSLPRQPLPAARRTAPAGPGFGDGWAASGHCSSAAPRLPVTPSWVRMIEASGYDVSADGHLVKLAVHVRERPRHVLDRPGEAVAASATVGDTDGTSVPSTGSTPYSPADPAAAASRSPNPGDAASPGRPPP